LEVNPGRPEGDAGRFKADGGRPEGDPGRSEGDAERLEGDEGRSAGCTETPDVDPEDFEAVLRVLSPGPENLEVGPEDLRADRAKSKDVPGDH
jgi:hypothetical protein